MFVCHNYTKYFMVFPSYLEHIVAMVLLQNKKIKAMNNPLEFSVRHYEMYT
jgi:hypothetical protein